MGQVKAFYDDDVEDLVSDVLCGFDHLEQMNANLLARLKSMCDDMEKWEEVQRQVFSNISSIINETSILKGDDDDK